MTNLTATQTETIMQAVIIELMNQGLTGKDDLIRFMKTNNFKLMFDTARQEFNF